MVKKSVPDEIVLDDIMKESMKEMGKGEIEQESIEQKIPAEAPKEEVAKPQFGFKLGEVKTPESFVVDSQKETDCLMAEICCIETQVSLVNDPGRVRAKKHICVVGAQKRNGLLRGGKLLFGKSNSL